MDYRNKLGTFTFDEDVQESHMKLVVQNVTGQYLNPKKGEPALTDEQSCYDYIRERCGNVLAAVGFGLEINQDVRRHEVKILSPKEEAQVLIDAFEDRMARALTNAKVADILGLKESTVRPSFGGWLVGPAAVR